MKRLVKRLRSALYAGWRVFHSEKYIVITQFRYKEGYARNYFCDTDWRLIDKAMQKLEEVRWSEEMLDD